MIKAILSILVGILIGLWFLHKQKSGSWVVSEEWIKEWRDYEKNIDWDALPTRYRNPYRDDCYNFYGDKVECPEKQDTSQAQKIKY